MPRTGTTLVERILGSHADVVSLGELVDFPAEMTALAERTYVSAGSKDPDLLRASLQMDFAELGRNYLKAVQPLAGGHRYFIDKLPFNFRYCGLIHQALPNARIVHLRRDPLDTCYAVFKTLFINAYHYSYQLDELAQFYVAYRQHDGALACRDAWGHLRRELRGPGRRSAHAVPQVARLVRLALAGRRAGFPPVAGGFDDGQCGTGALVDLHVVRAEMAQFRAATAARGAAARGSGAGRRGGQRIAVAMTLLMNQREGRRGGRGHATVPLRL